MNYTRTHQSSYVSKWSWAQRARVVLWFSSWVVLFSSFLPFVPHLLSQGPFLMLTITIFLSWDPSHSLYGPSNPYAIPYTTTGQGTLFAYLFLVMDDYSSSRFSHICCILLFPWHSMTFYSYSVEHSTKFCHILLLTQQISSQVYKSIHLYLFYTLDLRNTCIGSLLSWVTCSKA